MEETKQTGGLDYFRIAAALLVAAIHTSPLASLQGDADFVLTRVIARVAVPFFLMVTGYFSLADKRSIFPFLKRTLLLYFGATMLYLPISFYAGRFQDMGAADFLRMVVFDGTFYHLWYLPASVIGVCIVTLLGRRLPAGQVLAISALLYAAGLLGDSYYGLISGVPVLSGVYDAGFRVFSYTRNGIFYAPVFLAMGAWLRGSRRKPKTGADGVGFALCLLAMTGEGLALRGLGFQRHDSMYLMLLPCMYFLFRLLLSLKAETAGKLRNAALWIYLIHPMMIIVVRGAGRVLHLTDLLVDNSLAHYAVVCSLACIFAAAAELVRVRYHKPGRTRTEPGRGEKQVRTRTEPGRGAWQGRAWAELSRENLRHNVSELSALLREGCTLMPVVKADAYGHGAVLVAKELNAMGIRSFCVAAATEGAALRRGGIKGEILVLGYTHPEQFPLLRRYHLMQTVVDLPYALLLNRYGRKLRVHIKIDTGMHRLGVRSERLDDIYRIFCCKNLRVEGLYTHLCDDAAMEQEDARFTAEQGEAFFEVAGRLQQRGISCPRLHLQASYGLLNYPELSGDYARIGIALYGVLSRRADRESCGTELLPVLSVKARVASVKDLYQGETAGYDLDYVAEQDRTIAVVTIGYADGFPRAGSGNGAVLIRGEEAPVLSICMDQTIVDVTGISGVTSGDIAVIIGKSGGREITAYDLAEQSGTITNEILSRLGARLERGVV